MTLDIMMPFYGDVEKFKDAVLSVQRQSDPDWRLVILDDQYPSDEPRVFIDGLSDRRIRYLRNDRNLGISRNFQRSVDLSTADFVTIMGCDDLLLENYVGRMHKLITAYPDAAYIQPRVGVIDDAGRPTSPLGDRVKEHFRPSAPEPRLLSGERLATSLLKGNWTYFPSLCWNRETLQSIGFRQEYSIVLDLALQLSVIVDGGILLLDDEQTFLYRRHAASASSWSGGESNRFREEAALFAETATRLNDLGWKKAARAAVLHWTSRLNAVSLLPRAVVSRDAAGAMSLLRYATQLAGRQADQR